MRSLPQGRYHVGVRPNHIELAQSRSNPIADASDRLARRKINGSETYVHGQHGDLTIIASVGGIPRLRSWRGPYTSILIPTGYSSSTVQASSSRFLSKPAAGEGGTLMAQIEFKKPCAQLCAVAEDDRGLCAATNRHGMGGRRRLRAPGAVGVRQDHAAQHRLGTALADRRTRAARRRDVTQLPTSQRNIARCFSSPSSTIR